MEVFAEIVNRPLVFVYFAKGSISDILKDSESAYEANNDLREKIHLRFLAGFKFAFVAINYFTKSVGYLFSNFE